MNWFMNKPKNMMAFDVAKGQSMENLAAILLSLSGCINDGKVDYQDTLYNQLVDHIEEISAARNWDELEELIVQSKVLEQDIASWLSRHGKTSYALPWPKKH